MEPYGGTSRTSPGITNYNPECCLHGRPANPKVKETVTFTDRLQTIPMGAANQSRTWIFSDGSTSDRADAEPCLREDWHIIQSP